MFQKDQSFKIPVEIPVDSMNFTESSYSTLTGQLAWSFWNSDVIEWTAERWIYAGIDRNFFSFDITCVRPVLMDDDWARSNYTLNTCIKRKSCDQSLFDPFKICCMELFEMDLCTLLRLLVKGYQLRAAQLKLSVKGTMDSSYLVISCILKTKVQLWQSGRKIKSCTRERIKAIGLEVRIKKW